MLSTWCIIGNHLSYQNSDIRHKCLLFLNTSDCRWVISIIATKEELQTAASVTSNAGRIIQTIWWESGAANTVRQTRQNNLRACINRRTVKPDILFQMLNRSISFMQDTKTFLKNWRDLGHDTCHKTRGYDAKKCHQDCQKQEQGTFAKKCREGGGFYKCCIR